MKKLLPLVLLLLLCNCSLAQFTDFLLYEESQNNDIYPHSIVPFDSSNHIISYTDNWGVDAYFMTIDSGMNNTSNYKLDLAINSDQFPVIPKTDTTFISIFSRAGSDDGFFFMESTYGGQILQTVDYSSMLQYLSISDFEVLQDSTILMSLKAQVSKNSPVTNTIFVQISQDGEILNWQNYLSSISVSKLLQVSDSLVILNGVTQPGSSNQSKFLTAEFNLNTFSLAEVVVLDINADFYYSTLIVQIDSTYIHSFNKGYDGLYFLPHESNKEKFDVTTYDVSEYPFGLIESDAYTLYQDDSIFILSTGVQIMKMNNDLELLGQVSAAHSILNFTKTDTSFLMLGKNALIPAKRIKNGAEFGVFKGDFMSMITDDEPNCYWDYFNTYSQNFEVDFTSPVYEKDSMEFTDSLIVLNWLQETPLKLEEGCPDAPNAVSDVELIEVKVSPNPAANYLSIETEKTTESYEIYSIEGSLITCQGISKSTAFNVDISSLFSGFYFIRVQVGNQYVSKKFVKL